MEEKAKVAIIGGGVTGLFTAYYLAKKGVTDVVVLEKKYIGYGASGRNGGGVRQQWGTRENIELTRASVGVFERIAEEVNYPIWFNQGGYLILAHTEEEKREFDRMRRLQNSLGVKTRWLEPEEAREIVPEINTDFIIGANYNPTDGVLQPFFLLWGLDPHLHPSHGVQGRGWEGQEGPHREGHGGGRERHDRRGDVLQGTSGQARREHTHEAREARGHVHRGHEEVAQAHDHLLPLRDLL